MKRMVIMACFLTTCFLLIAGCSSMTDNTKPSRTESSTTDNTNLFIKIDIEKNGVPLDFLSSIASKDVINISQALQEKQENGSLSSPTMFKFSGNNIKRLSAGNYSRDYKVGLQVPISVSAPQAQGRDVYGAVINKRLGLCSAGARKRFYSTPSLSISSIC